MREEGEGLFTYWYSIGLFDVEDEVLDKGHLIEGEDDLEASGCHLSKDEKVKRDGINLEVTPSEITNHW